nr:MFS transporter [Niallia taxi]
MISYMADITPQTMYSRVYGFFNFSGLLSSIFAPYITGYIADKTGSLEIGLYFAGGLLIIGAALFIFTTEKYQASSHSIQPVSL